MTQTSSCGEYDRRMRNWRARDRPMHNMVMHDRQMHDGHLHRVPEHFDRHAERSLDWPKPHGHPSRS
jgi:hypothetical protein